MTNSPGSVPAVRTYSSGFRRALSMGALVTAILPAPVLLLHFLPAFRVQATFLAFYGPLVCFLALAYLFYIRDSLARAMFADLLDPSPKFDPYYGDPPFASLGRTLRRVRSVVLALLPIALILASSYCAVEYIGQVNRSVEGALEQKLREPTWRGDWAQSGALRRDTLGAAPQGRLRRRAAATPGRDDTARVLPSADSLRQYIFNTAGVDDIPFFFRLSVLYIGIFLSAEIAFVLMALKEYAKEAMGLTERDLMLGSNAAAPP
jgi:hypothetical protein